MLWLNSRRLRFLVGGTALFFLLFALLRVVFIVGFSSVDATEHGVAENYWSTFFIGLRFDMRLAILCMLPLVLLAYLPRYNLATSRVVRFIGRAYLLLALLSLVLLYFLDFGHYDYLGERLNATVFRFAGDAEISTAMLWQSYPVVWITLGWLGLSALFFGAFIYLERKTLPGAVIPIPRLQLVGAAVVVTLLAFVGILGRVSVNFHNPVPLRWSDAFFSGNVDLAAIGLNPIIFLFDTASVDDVPFERDLVKEHYPLVSQYLGVDKPDAETLSFYRHKPAGTPLLTSDGRAPNVVFVMLESLGASRVSAYGLPLKTTPNLDRLANEGWFFEQFYIPVSGTAKTIWASITGIPDVTRKETASRNPFISNQHTLINALQDYQKLYMLGGSASWANVRAVIRNSIDDITLYEEGFWKGPDVDTWGISDLQLFREADEVLAAQPKDKPFFAYIQTAGNHRPFTMPDDRGDFELDYPPEEEIAKWGFRSHAQYNAVRFLDYNVGEFMKMAERGGYLNNTIFVFFGDHNNRITQLPHMPPIQEQLGLESHHVPHIIYAPGLLEPRVIPTTTGLADVLPTLMGLLGVEYENRTMGRDIATAAPEGDRAVPLVLLEGQFPIIGMVTENFVLKMNYDGSDASLHEMDSMQPRENVAEKYPEVFENLSKLTRGTYETSRYMLYHNVR